MTFGHLAGELVRRVSGKELMEYLHDNILDPLEVPDFFIGLPDSVTDSDGKLVPFDQSRVADLVLVAPANAGCSGASRKTCVASPTHTPIEMLS